MLNILVWRSSIIIWRSAAPRQAGQNPGLARYRIAVVGCIFIAN